MASRPRVRESASFQLEYVRSPESIRPVDYIYTTREEQQRAAAREKENRDRLIAAQVERNRAVAEAIRKDTNATARIVAYQLVQASNGYPSFQIEVAKRYLAGDGVTTNRALAIHWLRAACTNGESEATNLLRQINLPP